MPETQSLVDLRSDVVMYAGPSETTRDYADKMLLAALQEAQTVAGSYDNKAQIVGVAENVTRPDHKAGALPTRPNEDGRVFHPVGRRAVFAQRRRRQ